MIPAPPAASRAPAPDPARTGWVHVGCAWVAHTTATGPSGWCWYRDPTHWARSGWASTPVHRGHLAVIAAAIAAAGDLPDDVGLVVETVSQYAVNALALWAHHPRAGRRAGTHPVHTPDNTDLLDAITYALTGPRRIRLRWLPTVEPGPRVDAATARAREVAHAHATGSGYHHGPAFHLAT